MSNSFKFEVVDESEMQKVRSYNDEYRPIYDQIVNLKTGQVMKFNSEDKAQLKKVYSVINGTFGPKKQDVNGFYCKQRLVKVENGFNLFVQKIERKAA